MLNETETFKQIVRLKINKKLTGYTCFTKAYMLFISEREINVQKSQVIAHFDKASSLKALLEMKLPMRRYTLPLKKESPSSDFGSLDTTDKTIGIEIDVSN